MKRNLLSLSNKLELVNIECFKALYGCKSLKLKGAWLLLNDTLPETFCNLAVAIRTTQRDAPHLLSLVDKYFEGKPTKVAFQVTPATTPKNFAELLFAYGFKKAYSESWMVHNKKITHPRVKEVEMIKVQTAAQMRKFIELFNSFGGNLPKSKRMNKFYEGVLWNSFKKRQSQIEVRHYLAILNQKPVGFGSLVVAKNYISIYNIGVLKQVRNRGIGKVLVNKLITDAKKLKGKGIFLQTTAGSLAQKFFKKMGFDIRFTADVFEKA
ncbi:GNAT family N-acetyltransferase [Patescibacteria group bacterium]|nr:GNAT family N-acetyltransferase [Patescibacteria group bacterium]